MGGVRYDIGMNVRQFIHDRVCDAAGVCGGQVSKPDERFGDWATNIAFDLSKQERKSPREVAVELAAKLEGDVELMKVVEKIAVEGGGFINFWLKEGWLVEELLAVDENYGRGEWGKGKRVLVDYSSPNIAKQFSVGHLRSTIIGQSLIDLYKFGGWETVGDNHLGDWGTQFGMIIAAVEQQSLDVSGMTVVDLENVYVAYNKAVKDDPDKLDAAREAFARLEKGEKKARDIWQAAINVSLADFDKVYKILGVKIDYAYGESAYLEVMPEVIEEAKEKKLAKISQGALIMELPDLPPAMLVKSNGTTTYFTRDLAAVKFRREKKELKSDLYIYEVGADQTLHFRQLFAAAERLGWLEKGQSVHIGHGLVLGKDRKRMSTRKGTNEGLLSLLNSMVEKAEEFNKDSAKVVGIGAVKFNDLMRSPTSNYIFDMDEALKLEGDSGPYVQYAYARAMNVLAKAGYKISDFRFKNMSLNHEEEKLVKKMVEFGVVAEDAARAMAPNFMCTCLIDLAKAFNAMYNKHRIIDADTHEQRELRLALSKASAVILKSGLGLLGIGVVEKM